MVCAGLETLTDNTIIGILQFPTSCFYNFYMIIMLAFFIVVSLTLYGVDRGRQVKADMISSLGVGAIATIFVSLFGTFIEIIQPDVFIKILVGGLVFIVIWLIKKS